MALAPQVALAHAVLLQSDPAPDAVLASAPSAITLIFTEPVTPAGVGIKVFSPTGAQVAGGAVSRGSILSTSVASTEVGSYIVTWQVFAADTHPSRGAFRFSVVKPSANPYAGLLSTGDIGTTTPLGLALQALARWVHFAGFALVFGVVAYLALVRRAGTQSRLVTAGVVLLIAAEPIALIGQLASLTFDGDTAIAVLGSNFGRLLGLRLAAAVLVWTLVAARRSWPLLVIGGAVALLDGVGAHAITGLPGVGQVLVAVHVSAMGLWVGGLAAYLRAPDRRFPRYAASTLAVAVGTGALLAFAHTGFAVALLNSDYGYVLIVKVLIVSAALVTVMLRRRRLELGAMLAVVSAAALLGALPPPR